MVNDTDWQKFAEATGTSADEFATIEGLTAMAQRYYEWTDSLTEEPNDGRALFGRDAMANYMIIGAKQLGCDIFETADGKTIVNLPRDVAKKLWDNYYVPYVKGFFASSGRFRSDDMKTGNVLAFVGSSAGCTFFPDHVTNGDGDSYWTEWEEETGMNEYTICVTETLQRCITIKADTEEQAIDKVQEMYDNEEIVLDSSDFIETNIAKLEN